MPPACLNTRVSGSSWCSQRRDAVGGVHRLSSGLMWEQCRHSRPFSITIFQFAWTSYDFSSPVLS